MLIGTNIVLLLGCCVRPTYLDIRCRLARGKARQILLYVFTNIIDKTSSAHILADIDTIIFWATQIKHTLHYHYKNN